MSIPDLSSWPSSAAKELRSVADLVAASEAPTPLGKVTLRFSDLRAHGEEAISNLTATDAIDRDRCIYVISVGEDVDRQKLIAAYSEARSKGVLKLPQDNKITSATLYVGSSFATQKRKGTLRTRLRQHLLSAPKGTYALSLAQWATGIDGSLTVQAWQFPPAADDGMSRLVVLGVEDWLSRELQPMLGRKGIRN
ncbi:hypothetical protein [Sphingobium ummariense]|uniref:Uncharacterized protein n=1 Tax=Sphingobium ummariense RL-3 TaxID=1346791 RepID=T0J0K4_9SPHN|nr:hypothetical protein [Sphingobium ummariense]EQB30347.1 hypothetical protein M529_20350 [Sphingobium ummariense RL-3]